MDATMNMGSDPRRRAGRSSKALRRTAAVAAVVAGAVHIPVTPEHLREAPYMGVMFLALTVACLGLAVGLWFSESTTVVAAAGMVCGAAIVGYVLTRTVAFPQLADDVGNWLEPLGVAAIPSEAVVVASCVVLVRGPPRR
ncbi:MAG: hypothetical protein ACR2KN_03495 [Geodermatophilaceae bacterium]